MPADVGFSMPGTGGAGASGAIDPNQGTTPPVPAGPGNPSQGLWAKLSQYLGQLNPEDLEKELKYVQQIIGGFNKVNSAAGQSQVAQKMMQEVKLMGGKKDENGQKRPYAPIQGSPTVTPEMAAGMLRTMGLR